MQTTAKDSDKRIKGRRRLLLPPLLLFAGLIIALMITKAVGTVTGLVLLAGLGGVGFWSSNLLEAQVLKTRRDALLRAREVFAARKPSPLRARIVEGVLHPLLLVDPRRKVLEANRAARDLLGKDILGKDVALALRQPEAVAALGRTIDNGESENTEVILHAGAERTFQMSTSLIVNRLPEAGTLRSEEEEPAYYIVISFLDITDIKATERMRADFVANASHELRTPLSSLIGFIETLQGPAAGDEEARERFLGIMHDEAARMVRLIDDLLSLSRIELEKHVAPRNTVNVHKAAESVRDLLSSAAAERDVSVRVDIPEDLPPVRGDADQIVQVIQNLLSNAIKYGASPGEVLITARLRKPDKADSQDHIEISISDEGEGIPPEHIPRLTERFYRVDTARSRKLGGTGLGLAIVKHIIDRHQGRMEIESSVGKGTTVHFALPVAESGAHSLDKAARKETAGPEKAGTRRSAAKS